MDTRQGYETKQLLISDAIVSNSYKVLRPVKSFFAPVKGIPSGTVLTLTGDILVEISMRSVASTIMPHVTVQVGVRWGKNRRGENMKGTDWITLTRFRRNTILLAGLPDADTNRKKRTADALRTIKGFAHPILPAK